MPVLVDPESEESKERRKWEMFPTALGPPGRPYEQLRNSMEGHFPVMLYRAQRIPGILPNAGKVATGCERPQRYLFPTDEAWLRGCEAAHQFGESCQRIAKNEEEYKRAKAEGWCDGAVAAVEAFEAAEHKLAELAANRAYEDRNMSEAAKAEAKAEDEAHFEHVAEVKEKPKVKRHRRTKAEMEAARAAGAN